MPQGEMALAFDLSALRALADPAAAVDDAREWALMVGVVSDAPESTVSAYAREHRIRRDFFPGERDARESLVYVRQAFDAPRYVYVGTDASHRGAATAAGWEYLPVEEAAEKAGWTLANEDGTGSASALDRLKRRLADLL
jgi:hypothetical protein